MVDTHRTAVAGDKHNKNINDWLRELVAAGDASQAGAASATIGTINADNTVSFANGGGANVMAQFLIGTASILGMQISAITGSTVVVELSNDLTTWISVRGTDMGTGVITLTTTATGLRQYPVAGFKYGRVRQSVYGSGTTAGSVFLSSSPASLDINIANALPSGVNNIGALGGSAASSGGTSTSRLLSAAASDNPTVVKASAGRLYRITGQNKKAASVYLKLYNKATAPTNGDTPVITEELLTASRFVLDWSALGRFFSAGIAYRITGAAADNDATNLVAADVVCMNVEYF